jgi:hypothetical protein
MEFVASLVGGLVWPVAIVIIMVIFRKPLANLIGDMSEGEAGPTGVKFKRAWRREAEAVRSEAASSVNADLPETAPPTANGDFADDAGPGPSSIERYHAATQPELAIQGAHRQLANRLREVLGEESASSPHFSEDITALAERAFRRGLIPPQVLNSVEGLSVLHSLAQAAPERVTPAQAQEFQVLTKAVLYTLRDQQLSRGSQIGPDPERESSGSDCNATTSSAPSSGSS